jgi:hypothetical protein
MLATCAQLIKIQSNLTDVAVLYGQLGYSDVVVRAAADTCTAAGVFPVPGSCSLYQVCTSSGTGSFLSSQGDCGSLNFDPVTLQCSSTYVCGSCTAAGVFPVPGNCSLYQVCTSTPSGSFLSSQGDCGNLNFDPVTLQCSSTYVCESCTEPGFFCITNTTFTLCADGGVPIISDYPCPSGFYCNHKCIAPCLNYVPDC